MRNEYRMEGDLMYILLKNKKGEQYETIINARHFEKVRDLKLSWHLQWDAMTQSYYCKATKYLGVIDGKPRYKSIQLHNVVKPITIKGNVIHHKNHDTLDNTDENLEEITNQKNTTMRKGANPNNKTGVRNVSYSKSDGKYIVQLQINGKNTRMGAFDNLEDAARCAELGREKYYPKD